MAEPKKIADNVWKISGESNFYYLDLDKKIVIDTGDKKDRVLVKNELPKVIEPEKIDIVIFTHLHYDHIWNSDLFTNAVFFCSKDALHDFEQNKDITIIDFEASRRFNVKLNDIIIIQEYLNKEGIEIIYVPGHTQGSLALYYKKKKILFSGDTIFQNAYGRTDLPTSNPAEMTNSIKKLMDLDFDILCPGHDY